ncbi:glutamate-1-semialdehyde 2,1-aminomutase [Rhodohalobacter sulfatireducens]|uniref:Glutamate-1-semialdehyde 2,1-aminomutase n=1 Tax=Rhodohalobacter sulfatireducens TaxID=2911366 RepID=A0ABS9K8E9_9BACT|nr:glutamate-1-semialdehyde 2,1-aminomutase [Rhodohalobacter sulfatireducens]MCG2587125.1 glutamate-1-semialdehyde 2,1-aminomutase [Rhodohalobacter sulfatireducens]
MLLKSEYLYKRAQKFIPGGVNSPARAFKSVGGVPVFFKKAKGSIITDEDGNEYIDYVGSWGPMILGHAHPTVIKAVQDASFNSTSFGAPTEIEIKMAELVQAMVPNVEKVRMVNSGTEACMSAIRVARGYTGKDKIIKFEGNYHGHGDSFLIKAGSGALTLGKPSSPGVTKGTAKDTLNADYNDLDSVEKLLKKNKDNVAAIIVEPVAGNMGCIPPQPGFLEGLRELCDEHKTVLIFDEVMTGFRLARGGAQERFDVWADLVTFGKIIGGGLPVGAFGGKKEIMDVVAPVGPVYQAGTLSGNPLAMSAGYAQLSTLEKHPELYVELEEKAEYLAKRLRVVLNQHEIDYHMNQVGSMASVYFTDQEVTGFKTANTTDQELFKIFFHEMLKRGIYLPPSPFESWFLATTLTNEMLDKTISAADESLAVAKSKVGGE